MVYPGGDLFYYIEQESQLWLTVHDKLSVCRKINICHLQTDDCTEMECGLSDCFIENILNGLTTRNLAFQKSFVCHRPPATTVKLGV